ncbi:anterior fat body protein [Penicillium antarcticum]|uniref:anterior fat body protein n=1 Tax=Penicillium antarcticum TaxID=416450 RepID=UPI0023914572|nr:anterior fat body protein [Penicillium antarcticum]KAJ5308811.1 anterior fat body protein [Penicillium antarcticum]
MTEPLESIDGGKPWYYCPKLMVLGESPIYRASDSTLHWVDCLSEPPELSILKVDPHTSDAIGEARVLPLEDSVTVAFFRKNRPGSYIAAYYQGVCFLDEETDQFEVVKEIIPTDQRDELRFNDGGIDAKGRFWLAEIDKRAMAFEPNQLPASYGTLRGRLWRYDPDGTLHLMIPEGVVCGNGLAWSPDNTTMYFNDSVAMVVFAFDFDLETGNISNKRLLVDRRSSPEGKHLKDIVVTAKNPACTTWGGVNQFMASGKDRSANPEPNDEGGHMFKYHPGDARGRVYGHIIGRKKYIALIFGT